MPQLQVYTKNDDETPNSIQMEQDDVTEVYQIQTGSGEDRKKAVYIKLKVVGHDSNEIHQLKRNN